jgi:hypothetical protein
VSYGLVPQITRIGGWRPSDPVPDHPNGVAVDIMIPEFDADSGRQLGDTIRDYLWTHRDQFHITYLIWRATYIPADGEPQNLTPTGDPTADHYNHVHVTVEGHGSPAPDQTYGAAPQLNDSANATSVGSSPPAAGRPTRRPLPVQRASGRTRSGGHGLGR